jgi:transketolase C-terminal domain/subunit
MVEREGISYIRITRDKTPILYADRVDDFRVGGSRIVRVGRSDDGVTVIMARITVYEGSRPPNSCGTRSRSG